MPNDVFLPFVIEQLNEGHTATLPLRGRSMRPFLEDGRDKALLQLCDHPQGIGRPQEMRHRLRIRRKRHDLYLRGGRLRNRGEEGHRKGQRAEMF